MNLKKLADEIAYPGEKWHNQYPPFGQGWAGDRLSLAIQKLLQKVRNETIEECAKTVQFIPEVDYKGFKLASEVKKEYAEILRALKETEK